MASILPVSKFGLEINKISKRFVRKVWRVIWYHEIKKGKTLSVLHVELKELYHPNYVSRGPFIIHNTDGLRWEQRRQVSWCFANMK